MRIRVVVPSNRATPSAVSFAECRQHDSGISPSGGSVYVYDGTGSADDLSWATGVTAPEFIPTNHTLLRMQQRRISFEEILAVLRSPDTSYLSPQGGEVLIGHPNGRRIKVVIEPGSSPPVVITVAD